MADAPSARARARARRRRRRVIVGVVTVAVVAGGAGTAWAMRGGDGPSYRLTSVGRGMVAQTVDADGTLAASGTRAVAFASGGTVTAVRVAVGNIVRTGQTLATIDPSKLENAVTDADTTLAQAKQTLADREDAQANGTTATVTTTAATTDRSTGTTTESSSVRLLAATAPMTAPSSRAPSGGASGGGATGTSTSVADVKKAQAAVVSAQQALDATVAAQDKAVATLVTACAAHDETTPATYPTTVGASLTITGSSGAQATVVTLRDANGDVAQTTAANPQQVAAAGSYSFTGLTAGATYTVAVVRTGQLDAADCTAAVTAVQSAQAYVDKALQALDTAIAKLTAVISALSTSTRGSGGGSGSGSSGAPSGATPSRGSGPGQSSSGSGRPGGGSGTGSSSGASQPGTGRSGTGQSGTGQSGTGQSDTGQSGAGSGGGSTEVLITAQQLAADAQAVDAARAELAVAKAAVANATLTSPISGTVAVVAIAKGDTVTAASTTSTITVVGTGTLSVTVDVSLADIDLVKVGQDVRVTVDGHPAALPAKVTDVSMANSADSTGTSSTYPVTVQLSKHYPNLYDGMGAAVAIEVGTARNVLTVPISAVHTIGTVHTVTVYKNGAASAARVTLGLVGDATVQVRSGVALGTQLVLADLGAAVPTSTGTTNRRNTGSSLTGLTGTGAGAGGGFAGGAPRGGRPGG